MKSFVVGHYGDLVLLNARELAKFDFGWGSAPNTAGGAYSAPPDP